MSYNSPGKPGQETTVEELPYPIAEVNVGWRLSTIDAEILRARKHRWMLNYQDTINEARIMLMRTRIGPDVPPAKKNLAVFLKYI